MLWEVKMWSQVLGTQMASFKGDFSNPTTLGFLATTRPGPSALG